MKIAFFIHCAELYGSNRSLLNLLNGLDKYNVTPIVVVPYYGEITDELSKRNMQFIVTPIQSWVLEARKEKNILLKTVLFIYDKLRVIKKLYINLSLLPSLLKNLRYFEVDIIYTSTYVMPVGIMIAKLLRLPHVWHLREYPILQYNFRDDFGVYFRNFLINKSDEIITISNSLKEFWNEYLPDRNIYMIYNGIASNEQFDRYYQLNLKKKDKEDLYTFAIVGLLYPNKGQLEAIKALNEVIKASLNARLLIVGGGMVGEENKTYVRQLKKSVVKFGLENNVEFWGYITNPYEAFLSADAVLMCSRFEAMGRVTIEAMVACKPVIGFNHGATPELIKHEYNGLIYNNNHHELACCMMRLIENPEWSKQLGLNAWSFARDNFSTERCAAQVYEILKHLTTK